MVISLFSKCVPLHQNDTSYKKVNIDKLLDDLKNTYWGIVFFQEVSVLDAFENVKFSFGKN